MSLDQTIGIVKHQTPTRDAFLGGRLTLSQPRQGFRAGLDSVLLGASVPEAAGTLLDLGAGVGTAGLVAMALGRARQVDLLERDSATADLARLNLDENGFAGRGRIMVADLTSPSDRQHAGLGENTYDVVIANPPYFAAGQGTLAQQPDRADARHMESSALDLWLRCAAASAVSGGMAIAIYPVEGLAALLAAFDRRFGAITVLPLTPRTGLPVTRILVRGIKGSRAPLTLLSSRALHEAEGHHFTAKFDAVFRGESALHW